MRSLRLKRQLNQAAAGLLMASCGIAIQGCGGSGEPSGGAEAPAPVSPPLPTHSAIVSWSVPTMNTDGTAITDLYGFRIHYGTSAMNLSLAVVVPDATTTSYTVTGLSPGTYYFAVASLNSAQASSDLSNVASKTVP
jgi:Fibronectin type III domain